MNKNADGVFNYPTDNNYPPDELEIEGSFKFPNDDFVISRDYDGKPVSFSKDSVYDLSPYRSTETGPSKITFAGRVSPNYTSQAKHLFLIFYYLGQGRSGAGYSPASLVQLHSDCTVKLCAYASDENKSIYEILGSQSLLTQYIQHIYQSNTRTAASALSTLLNILIEYNSQVTGIHCEAPSDLRKTLKALSTYTKNEWDQHPVIPCDLYLGIINNCWEVVDNFIQHQKNIEILAEIENEISKAIRAGAERHQFESFMKSAAKLEMAEFFERHNVQRLSSYFRTTQAACKTLIHAYSGMRDQEALSLRFNCLELPKDRSNARFIGTTTKLTGIKKATKWVTTVEIERVVDVLRTICEIVCERQDIRPEEFDCPLFVSTQYLVKSSSKQVGDLAALPKTSRLNISITVVYDPAKFIIKEHHIQELEKIDPDRNWRSEPKYKIDASWNFTSHQFRRSLAVYAAQSGLVTLGAMKIQFQHLFREMTYYYQNGCSAANDVLGIKNVPNHIGTLFNEVKPMADAVAYIFNTWLSDEPLFGAKGELIEKERKNISPIQLIQLREDTIKKMKNGQAAFTETHLGGCGSIETCEDRIQLSLVACISCPDATIKMSKLDFVIGAQKKVLRQSDNAFDRRIAKEDLEELESFRRKHTGKEK